MPNTPLPRTRADAAIEALIRHEHMTPDEAAHWVHTTGGGYPDIVRWRMDHYTAEDVFEAYESDDFGALGRWPR